ncbi:MAG TPA: peptide ligase PGM1-related protein [Bauldia sp.]|nr:peptide ligase PGM1-related protein [Bauldia sp.]
MKSFAELQAGFGPIWELNSPGHTDPHAVIAFPSFALGETTLAHYATRLAALEHRYLLAMFMMNRMPNCRFVYMSTEEPAPEVLDYYFSLFPPEKREAMRNQFVAITLPDHTARSVADKLLGRPDVMDKLRAAIDGVPAFIEPWNVTDHEVEVARQLQTPINGTAPELWPLGFKSEGRRIFRMAGVPIPFGREDVKTVDDVVDAIADIRRGRPNATGVVVKHDNSAAGDGNVVIRFAKLADASPAGIRRHVEALPEWYLRDLKAGGIVEELIAGTDFTSPSAQVDITPFGHVHVVATHEQMLGGDDGQVYQGCRFPADPGYAARLAEYGVATAQVIAPLGVLGRFAIDFACAKNEQGEWQVCALEMNLRKGGTTHPYAALRNLVPGHYDPKVGTWFNHAREPRHYVSTDNMVDAKWHGLPSATVIQAIAEAGLAFDHARGWGVVLHMLSCLKVDGRFGLTAIGTSPSHAQELFDAVRPTVERAVANAGYVAPPAA